MYLYSSMEWPEVIHGEGVRGAVSMDYLKRTCLVCRPQDLL